MFVKFVSKLIKKMRTFTKLLSYLFSIFTLLLWSCHSSEPTKKINLDDIRPKSNSRTQKKSSSIEKDTLASFYNYYANDSAQLGIAKITLDTTLKTHFLDRFSTAKKRLLLTDSTSQKFQYLSWSFADSAACFEAFYNWLDQAGLKQQSIQLGSGDVLHATHGLYVIAKNELFFLHSEQPLAYQKWLKWFEGKPDNSSIHYVLRMKPKQKTKWFQYSNNKMLVL